jgi:hypothetical protein
VARKAGGRVPPLVVVVVVLLLLLPLLVAAVLAVVLLVVVAPARLVARPKPVHRRPQRSLPTLPPPRGRGNVQ